MYEQDSNTVRHNLALAGRRTGGARAARYAALADAAALFAASGSALSPTLPALLSEGGGASLSFLSGGDRLAFLSAYLAAREARGEAAAAPSLLPTGPAPDKSVTYVRNPYADEACAEFFARYGRVPVYYADGFDAACRAVANGRVGYCILPYENEGGILSGFSETAVRFSLRIVSMCRVFHTDDSRITHFALYSRTVRPEWAAKAPCLRFSFTCPADGALSLHLGAAEAAGGHLCRLDCLPDADAPGMLTCTATLRLPSENLILWLHYLSVFTENPTIRGLYEE